MVLYLFRCLAQKRRKKKSSASQTWSCFLLWIQHLITRHSQFVDQLQKSIIHPRKVTGQNENQCIRRLFSKPSTCTSSFLFWHNCVWSLEVKVQQLLLDLQTNFVNDITTIHPLETVFTRYYFSWVCCQAVHDVLNIIYRTPLLANVFYWLFISISEFL